MSTSFGFISHSRWWRGSSTFKLSNFINFLLPSKATEARQDSNHSKGPTPPPHRNTHTLTSTLAHFLHGLFSIIIVHYLVTLFPWPPPTERPPSPLESISYPLLRVRQIARQAFGQRCHMLSTGSGMLTKMASGHRQPPLASAHTRVRWSFFFRMGKCKFNETLAALQRKIFSKHYLHQSGATAATNSQWKIWATLKCTKECDAGRGQN